MPNRLANATSPYLLQHQDNPVDWREWNAESLAEAKAANRPILLSVGYAACHWCHVMAHESFENRQIAAAMNRSFVSIKVDREERPDLDSIYQQALALLGQQGGWPLTMFLTPNGEPFWGGTYFPPEPRYGRPSFPQVLEQIAALWAGEPGKVEANRQALRQALGQLARAAPGDIPMVETVVASSRALAEELDAVHGGFGGAPKFPQTPGLNLLWQVGLLTGDEVISRRLLHTLSRICQGGIYDHLGGGFARYSVDAFWLVPHFEKMLYDNAQLLELLGEAWAASGNPLYRVRAEETVEWLRREMLTEGAFAASLDADTEGEEGKFYVWDADEIDRVLGDDARTFKLAYGVTRNGNWEHKNVLNRLHVPGLGNDSEEAFLARCRAQLFRARSQRPAPGRDDKLLADWNGLMIAALARTGPRLNCPDWVELARGAFDAIVQKMSDGDRLVHSFRAGRRLELAFLDDYAQMISAALALYEATGDPQLLARAQTWTEVVDAEYADPAGGYFLAAATPDLILRPKNAHDGPTPSANGTLALESARLWWLTGEDRHRERAESILRAFGGEARHSAFAHSTLLRAALLLAHPVQIVLLGSRDQPAWQKLYEAVVARAVPNRVLTAIENSSTLPPSHPAAGKTALKGQPTVYVCPGQTCLAPAASVEDVAARLNEATRVQA